MMMMSTSSSTASTITHRMNISRAAVGQLRSTRDKRSNLINIAKCAGWAQREGAHMLFLPECLGFMGDNAEHTLREADPPIVELLRRQKKEQQKTFYSLSATTPFRRVLAETIAEPDDAVTTYATTNNDDDKPSSIIEELCFIANESKLWISGGGVHTSVPSSDLPTTTATSGSDSNTTKSNDKQNNNTKKIYNTHVIIDNQGQIKSHYHKIHLFDVSIPQQNVNLRESKTTRPGNTRLVSCPNTPCGTLGLSICYDMRFPEMYVELVQNFGSQVLLMPSAFTVPTGKAHWHALLKGKKYL